MWLCGALNIEFINFRENSSTLKQSIGPNLRTLAKFVTSLHLVSLKIFQIKVFTMDFQDVFSITALASLLVALVEAEAPQIVPSHQGQDQGIHQMNQQQRASRFRDKSHIQDKE